MQSHLSPKDLAAVVGVSESSLKRWVDDGRLMAERTTGGHRRIPMHEAVRFIRETAAEIAAPELLGVRGLTAGTIAACTRGISERTLMDATAEGNIDEAVGLLMAELLRSRTVAAVFDGQLAMLRNHTLAGMGRHQAGTDWHTAVSVIGDRACDFVSRMLPPVRADASPAVVHDVTPRPASGRARMVELVLRECGYRATDVNHAASQDYRSGSAHLVCIVIGPDSDLGATGQELPASAANKGRTTLVCGPGAAAVGQRIGAGAAESMCELACCARAARFAGDAPTAKHNGSVREKPVRA